MKLNLRYIFRKKLIWLLLGIGCGRRYFPGIYTNVHHYNHWIRQEINLSSHVNLHHKAILAAMLVFILGILDF